MTCWTGSRHHDEEQGQGEMTRPGGSTRPHHEEIGMNDTSLSPEEPPDQQHQDFDDGANDLWSLYGKEAQVYDESRINSLKGDMEGILIFAGLFSGVLTAFVVLKIQDLKVNPADQSAYYQNQTVHMLDRISQQFASVDRQIPYNYTPPLPFHSSASDRRVNTLWLLSLVCSLSAALLATLVQQWSKAYMHIFQQANNPLQIARFRAFLFEGSERLPVLAQVVLGLIHISLILFFLGLGDFILQIDSILFVIIMVPITVCVCLYLYCIIAPIRNPQSPYRTPFSGFIWFIIQNSHFHGKGVKPMGIEKHQERSSMEGTDNRMNRDVRAIQWLVQRSNGSDEMQALVQAIPGSFNRKWGRRVWTWVMRGQSTSPDNLQAPSHSGFSSARGGTAVYELCRRVRYFFETFKDEENSLDAGIGRTRRIHGYVETAAFLVCCTRVELGLFGNVEKVLSRVLNKLGVEELRSNPLTIISNPTFTVRWTCLSLVAIWKMVDDNTLQERAKFALDGIARLHTEYGIPDMLALMTVAQRIDDYLTKAWESVVDLPLAFDSEIWGQSDTGQSDTIIGILHELERIADDAGGMEDVDWRISLFQERMVEITHGLIQRLPGIYFDKLKSAEALGSPSVRTTPVPPQLIFPGQQIQSLCTLGRRLRDIVEGGNAESHGETLKSLESLRDIPVSSLRGLKHWMTRQVWRLLDLRDGCGFGFTVELFFLSLRQPELLSTFSLSDLELTKVIYTGTFEVITSNWKKSKNSAGTQRILLDILCDLVIRNRGVFSDSSYPPYIVKMLLDLVRKMVEGHQGLHPHINEVIEELLDDTLRHRMDNSLRDEALDAIGLPFDKMPPYHSGLEPAHTQIPPLFAQAAQL